MRPLSANTEDRIAPSASAKRFAEPISDRVVRLTGNLWRALFAVAAPSIAEVKRGARRRRSGRRRQAVRLRHTTILIIIVVVAAVAVVGSGIWLWQSGQADRLAQLLRRGAVETMVLANLTVQQITLAGRERTPPGELLAALDVKRGDPILTIDLAAAHARLQALGWVRSATLSRLLPDRLHVEIDERVPIARWQRRGEIVLIDGEGAEITKHGLNRYRRLPRVVGKGAAPLAAGLLDVLASEPELYRHVRWAALIRERRWDVGLTDGLIVRLPESDIRKEWRRLSRFQKSEKILSKDLAVIDLRIPGRLILRLTESGRKTREILGNTT